MNIPFLYMAMMQGSYFLVQLYEREVEQLEREAHGNAIRWLRPEPCFVIKTRTIGSEDGKKIFVNICSSAEIDVAYHKKAGNWAIPYSLAGPRVDIDKSTGLMYSF